MTGCHQNLIKYTKMKPKFFKWNEMTSSMMTYYQIVHIGSICHPNFVSEILFNRVTIFRQVTVEYRFITSD